MAVEKFRRVPPAAFEVAPIALVGWGGLSKDFAEEARACRRRRWLYDAEGPYYDARGFGIARLPTGAPAAVALLDQLVACGALVLVTVGVGGSLLPTVAPGTVVVAADAIAGDRTSPRYSNAGEQLLSASPALVRNLTAALIEGGADVRVGTTWTTDAPLRGMPATVESSPSHGALTVDMETAAVYALAAYRGVAACSVLFVTGRARDRWNPAFDTPPVRQALDVVGRTLPEAVGTAASRGELGD